MSIEYTNPQFTWTTADDELHLFSGEISEPLFERDAELPSGQYRVVDGQLFLIVDGVPQLP